MTEENVEKLPLELLMEKYVPINVMTERYGIRASVIMDLIQTRKIRRAEFKVPGDRRRTLHVNYEEVLSVLGKECQKNETNTSS